MRLRPCNVLYVFYYVFFKIILIFNNDYIDKISDLKYKFIKTMVFFYANTKVCNWNYMQIF